MSTDASPAAGPHAGSAQGEYLEPDLRRTPSAEHSGSTPVARD